MAVPAARPRGSSGAPSKRLKGAAPSGPPSSSTATPAEKSFHENAVANHVESFNALIDEGLKEIALGVDPIVVEPLVGQDSDPSITIKLLELTMERPTNISDKKTAGEQPVPGNIFPRDCRVGHFNYSAPLRAKFWLKVSGAFEPVVCEMELGRVPVMIRSKACHLYRRSPKDLVRAGEDENECGGYFVVNGNERVIRMLVMPRANFPMAIERGSYKNRGPLYTGYATLFRGKRPDGSTQTNTLHYLTDGSCWMRFSHGREEWFIPLVAVAYCLHPFTDELFVEMLCGVGDHWTLTFLRERAMVMLQHQASKHKLNSRRDAYTYLGKLFRVTLGNMVPRSSTNEEVGIYLINRFVLVHTKEPSEKLQTLCIMWQKLMGLVRHQLEPENQDTMSSHELLLPGQLYGIVLKEAIEVMLLRVRGYILKLIRVDEHSKKRKKRPQDFATDEKLLQLAVKSSSEVENALGHFLATGNIKSRSGLDLLQQSGYTIVGDKLNFARWTSHFVAVHRGQYFTQMKTTTVRKLLPETWGFLCPVHTPDGSPCGLLNHLARSARGIWTNPQLHSLQAIEKYLRDLGVEMPYARGSDLPVFDNAKYAWVTLDGKPLGKVHLERLTDVASKLRKAKLREKYDIPSNLEIVCVTPEWKHLFPGLFLFLGPGRLVRPVRSLDKDRTELIGPLEQVFLNIACTAKEVYKARNGMIVEEGSIACDEDIPEQTPVDYTHMELKPTEIFSLLAALTPFSNHNQSPRNMYQCQMLKQTMGTAYHNHPYRSDNKVYKIQNPQKPIVRTEMYNTADMDSHPQGCNAVVAVITYTGYDMEDSMIINKHSFERGFGHGIVYKTKIIEAAEDGYDITERKACRFTNVRLRDGVVVGRYATKVDPSTNEYTIDDDGLPVVGTLLQNDDPIAVWVNPEGMPQVIKFHDDLPAYVETVTLCHGEALPGVTREFTKTKALIKLRYPRNPMIGDKFSSRHGQKGVMSRLWPAADMPFSENGVTPDILFNPHGFPSRMTIGMLIECMAAKAAAKEGLPTVDGTTFRQFRGELVKSGNNEEDPFLIDDDLQGKGEAGADVANYFGNALAKHGFQRLGTERLYSGIHGTEIETEIFMGVIYYQRLRHMVADKAQVRMRGPVDRHTNQPVKGRKKHGGIRFGEMERDSLLAHGTAFLLHDRLMRSSDFDIGFVCPICGSVLTPQANAWLRFPKSDKASGEKCYPVRQKPGRDWECPPCSKDLKRPVRCYPMPVPWIFRYLTCELAAMNVRLQVTVKSRARDVSLSNVLKDT